MKIWLIIFAALCPFGALPAQHTVSDNIVPNPGFERYRNAPIGWSYKSAFFGQVMKYWFSATTSSPDVYGPDVKVPRDWAKKGFGEQQPHKGKSMAGLTLYGCTNGKPHCREYIEIQLAEPLVVGQTYLVEFWVAHLPRSLQINRIGAHFTEKRIERKTEEFLKVKAHFSEEKIVEAPDGKWVRVSGTFQADKEYEYLILGNFYNDDNTQTMAPREDCFNYAYYYVDDVVVKKIPPILTVPIKPDDLTRQTLEAGKTIVLKNIYFEFDQDELMPRSFVELRKLLQIMQENPNMVIEIIGHTDNIGDDDYNKYLSRARAKSVVFFLLENKILPQRLRYRGAGEKQPVATNNTEEGRAQNRRVEFAVVRK
ncbi:MAG: OmpA family protein [Saprospiraceae bacterium]